MTPTISISEENCLLKQTVRIKQKAWWRQAPELAVSSCAHKTVSPCWSAFDLLLSCMPSKKSLWQGAGGGCGSNGIPASLTGNVRRELELVVHSKQCKKPRQWQLPQADLRLAQVIRLHNLKRGLQGPSVGIPRPDSRSPTSSRRKKNRDPETSVDS